MKKTIEKQFEEVDALFVQLEKRLAQVDKIITECYIHRQDIERCKEQGKNQSVYVA